ncbi:ATP-binding protein [Geobacter sp. SVR]|uniref:ATP-binding protein n=1 Tax=Geobacter sp. SVR TaxID=2495594 RepID=UPI00143F0286|nr:ATP-binding protein [Geobacter sp. SVR]BCS53497.1 anti-sigma factor [Geobacter sp. SVR]GCF85376.1 anti-sigma factor [Geobacter sp. SVR]
MKNEIEIQIKVPNQTRYLSLIGRIGEIVARELDRFTGDREAFAHHLNLVLTEAMVNAIKHANANDPDKEVHVRIIISTLELVIRVYDSGQGFDLDTIPNPCEETDPLEEKGRGLFIIRSLMDSVVYKNLNGGNVLEMKKMFK